MVDKYFCYYLQKYIPVCSYGEMDHTIIALIFGSLIWSKTLTELIQYLTPVVNFGEVRRTQLAKSTLLTAMSVPLGSFKVCSDTKERVG